MSARSKSGNSRSTSSCASLTDGRGPPVTNCISDTANRDFKIQALPYNPSLPTDPA